MAQIQFHVADENVDIRFNLGMASLGSVLVATSPHGICAISLGDDPDEMIHSLQNRFPNARRASGDQDFERLMAQVLAFIEAPTKGLALSLDIRGSAFQQRVWQALREIPVGGRSSYSEIAQRIGAPKAARAVAGACAANNLAVAIPCHRVVRINGDLSGYRWGVARKAELLRRESEL